VRQGPDGRQAGAVPYALAFARVLGGAAHLAAALADPGAPARLATCYMVRLLPDHAAHLAAVRDGGETLLPVTPQDLRA